ncbi:hypothetical protein [Chitinibacter tainanensis]|uniref:hypothetical protein n=1 Tax=Chitinibacter tainanensis TaxID=230667 RepID=UPI0012EC7267|nr:hypothetical protein [Chitinibacter tainanensis]
MDEDILAFKKIAREAQACRVKGLKHAHSKVIAMLRSRRSKNAVVRAAMKQVKKWKYNKLCSSDYISDWTSLLSSPRKVAALLEDDSVVSNRLRQNTPFAAYLLK